MEAKEKAKKVLDENLFGVHKEMIKNHWAFEDCIIQAMIKFSNP